MTSLNLATPIGFKTGGLHCGIKKRRKDLALIYSETPAVAVGVFTTNQVQAAPVKYTKQLIDNGTLQAIIANSGNANCSNGPQGEHDTKEMARITAQELGIDITKVAVASTGSIGKPLPMRTVSDGIEKLTKKINHNLLPAAAEAIMTTDTFAKGISKTITIGNKEVTISAIAKGAGMIEPNMATMLCFIITDLAIDQKLLQQLVTTSVNQSFNCISVDGCMSTNDMVLALANGMAENETINAPGKELDLIQLEFNEIAKSLAKSIVSDGEGATKLVTINVTGTHSETEARIIGKKIANSTLLKCSFFGETLNIGRILAATGASGIDLEPQNIDVSIGEIPVIVKNHPTNFSKQQINIVLKQKEFSIDINLNLGNAKSTVWTCDLTHKYIKINME